MIIYKEKKTVQIIGGGDLVKFDDDYNYYLTNNPTSDKQRHEMRNKLVFKGTKKECQDYLKNNFR
jgi:signal peptidase I